MSVPWPAPFDEKAATARLRIEREVKLRLLYEVRAWVEPEIRFLEQLLKGGERG